MFRDDHEAALARLQAVEAELANEKSKDVKQEQRLASLEAELRAAKAKLHETETELAKHRPPPPKPAPTPAPFVEDAQGVRPRSMLTLGLLAAVLVSVVGLAVWANIMSRRDSQHTRTPDPPKAELALPDSISALLPEIRARGEQELPGSRLVELSGEGITSEGALHETYGELEATFYRTVEPAEPEVDPKLPVGAAPPVAHSPLDRHKCAYVKRTATGWRKDGLAGFHLCILGDRYERRSSLDPACTMKSIWQRAIVDGAPANGIAMISLQQSEWEFEINDQRLQFRRTYRDDCQRN